MEMLVLRKLFVLGFWRPPRRRRACPTPFHWYHPPVFLTGRRRPWFRPHVANPRFPLQVQVLSARWKYNGNHEYKGAGILALVGQSTQDIAYHYRCVNSFEASDTYQARWVKPGQTLEILMSGPRSHHTNTCRLDTHS